MKLKDLFRSAVEAGIAADPRGKAFVEKMLKKEKERAKDLKGDDKKFYDEDRQWNPYLDSRIISGTGEEDIKCVMVGIDIEASEMILADRLREKGYKIDAVMIHHPEGRALADLDKVMPLMVDLHAKWGVPVNQTEGNLRPRMDRIWRAIHADNLFRTERTAEVLGLPAFNTHTITDNMVFQFMEKHICSKPFDSLGDIINAVHKIPEYEYYAKKGNPCILAHGSRSSRPGKIAAAGFTGGTNGPEDMLAALARAGVGTVISMHATEKEVEVAQKEHINIVQCSHMASDVIGMNLLLDLLSKKEKKLTTVDVSGFIRVKR
jgi:hypothetical protein